MKPLNLFYEDPDPDRWLPFDRYPRRLVRRLVRGPARVGGHTRVFLNLCMGLDLLGIPYRVNDYRYAHAHSLEAVGIVGKPPVLDKYRWRNPILFGTAVFSHPIQDPDLLTRLPVRRVLVPGEWARKMWEPHYGDRVTSWPVGIDTATWTPDNGWPMAERRDVLLYDKILWEHATYEADLIDPVRATLKRHGIPVVELRYGFYKEGDFRAQLARCKAMVFFCFSETQGIAYQQALASGVPILAWDAEGFWRDPGFYPDQVRFKPASSVPYWDGRCGVKFRSAAEFDARLDEFLGKLARREFAPRDYILENLTLEKCARRYVELYRQVEDEARA